MMILTLNPHNDRKNPQARIFDTVTGAFYDYYAGDITTVAVSSIHNSSELVSFSYTGNAASEFWTKLQDMCK